MFDSIIQLFNIELMYLCNNVFQDVTGDFKKLDKRISKVATTAVRIGIDCLYYKYMLVISNEGKTIQNNINEVW